MARLVTGTLLRLEVTGDGTGLNGQGHPFLSSRPLRASQPFLHYNLMPKQEGSTGEGPAALERQGVAAPIHHFAVTLSFGRT